MPRKKNLGGRSPFFFPPYKLQTSIIIIFFFFGGAIEGIAERMSSSTEPLCFTGGIQVKLSKLSQGQPQGRTLFQAADSILLIHKDHFDLFESNASVASHPRSPSQKVASFSYSDIYNVSHGNTRRGILVEMRDSETRMDALLRYSSPLSEHRNSADSPTRGPPKDIVIAQFQFLDSPGRQRVFNAIYSAWHTYRQSLLSDTTPPRTKTAATADLRDTGEHSPPQQRRIAVPRDALSSESTVFH